MKTKHWRAIGIHSFSLKYSLRAADSLDSNRAISQIGLTPQVLFNSMDARSIFIVEDTDSLREVLVSVLQHEGFNVETASSAEVALPKILTGEYDCILCDFRLPRKNGLELLEDVRSAALNVPFLIMTAYGSIELAVDAMKAGANDFITKPFQPEALISNINEVISHRRIIRREMPSGNGNGPRLNTQDPGFLKILSQAKRVAQVDSTVLLLGESGTGKELTARFIHEHSKRRNEAFVAINCGAIPADLLESELFGHVRGAFTGATQDRQGLFEYASKGTIFLDEIGDMPASLQVKLLRALQEGEIRPVGSNRPVRVNPRIVAATNQDLEEGIATGKIREDFYYRIAVVTFKLPPLRERPDDIEGLALHFISYFAQKNGRMIPAISREALDFLRRNTLPGNARELENIIQRAVILADETIRPEHLGLNLDDTLQAIAETQATLPAIAEQAVRKAEMDMITRTLRQTLGNKSKAAQLLGISYKTLLNKVKEYELSL